MKRIEYFHRSARRRYVIFIACALAFALIGGATGAHIAQDAFASEAQSYVPYSSIYTESNPIPEISSRVRPAVVQVINILETWTRQDGAALVDQGYGSGVYIDQRGYIVTNRHVIMDADLVEIETLAGQRIRCDIVGADDGTDIAVLKAREPIDAQPVPLGDSDHLQIGELAIAIGNPGDSAGVLFGTVTAGIISALDRENVNANNFNRRVSVIQTDAAINTGNSGGALLNARGELIGIPTLKIMSDYGTVYEGLGFAVPINTAAPIINQLIETGKVMRPRLGISVASFVGPNEPLRNYPPAGAQVMSIEETGAAGQAGIRLYDIITEIEGVRVMTSNDLIAEIDRHGAGESVRLKLYRCFDLLDGSLLSNPEALEVNVELRIID